MRKIDSPYIKPDAEPDYTTGNVIFGIIGALGFYLAVFVIGGGLIALPIIVLSLLP